MTIPKSVSILNMFPDRLENIVGKGENADNLHYLFFPTMFSKGIFSQGC